MNNDVEGMVSCQLRSIVQARVVNPCVAAEQFNYLRHHYLERRPEIFGEDNDENQNLWLEQVLDSTRELDATID